MQSYHSAPAASIVQYGNAAHGNVASYHSAPAAPSVVHYGNAAQGLHGAGAALVQVAPAYKSGEGKASNYHEEYLKNYVSFT